MSLEDSMNTLSESNLKLASAMDRYATVMQNIAAGNPSTIVGPNTDAAPAPAAAADKKTGGRRTKAQIEADAAAAAKADAGDANDADPFGDDDAGGEPELTADVIRKVVLAVKEKNKDHALGLLKKLGVAKMAQIEEKDYPKVVELAGKCGVTLADIADIE